MPMLAVGFPSIVWGHGKALPKNPARWIKYFLQGFKGFCPLQYSVRFKSGQVGKDRCFIFDALNYHDSGNAGIKHLIFLGCPTAIRLIVIPVVIHALNCEPIRTFAHVLNKCWEAIFPSVADRNFSAAVVSIGWIFRIKASLLYLKPSSIERVSAHIVSFSHLLIMGHDIKNVKEVSNVV